VDKALLVDAYKTRVVDTFDPANYHERIWGFEPYEPYLTNKYYLHSGNSGRLTGVWRLKNVAVAVGFPNDILTFIEASSPAYQGNHIMAQDLGSDDYPSEWFINGTYDVNYDRGQLTIYGDDGKVHYGIFTLDESTGKPTLTIEYQEGALPDGYSEESYTYELVY
jgi:hypothetical protein